MADSAARAPLGARPAASSQRAPGRPPSLRVGRLTLAPPVLQAPMSALTNLPQRTLAEEHGCALTFTEFLPASGLATGNRAVLAKLCASRARRPFGVQLYGREPAQMRAAAERAVSIGAAVVDINMGCPTRKVTRGVCGCALMREPQLAAELVRAVKEAVAGRAAVTVKLRAGWDARHKNAPEFASLMAEAGAEAVTVHGRTRAQRFDGPVDHAIIARVKQAVDVPVIANGDIVDVASLARAIENTGADGVMIGRAALGNPWLFREIAAWYRGEPAPPPPTAAERIRMYLAHLDLYLEIADERRAVYEMRKFAVAYLQPIAGAEPLRQRLNRIDDLRSIRELLGAQLAARGDNLAG